MDVDNGHGTFCGQTKPISISKVLSVLKIAEYGQERIRSKCNHCPFILKRSLWCGFGAVFIVGPFFFEEICPSGHVTCTVNGTRYESLLRNQLIPAMQQSGCVDNTIFMQDGAPPLHISTPGKKLLNLQFGDDNYQSPFPNSLAATITGPEPLRLMAVGLLKNVLYGNPIANLAELKTALRNIFTISPLKHSDLLCTFSS
ncbi:hypothetical protein AVEN_191032-1 [Araneus ventricosus]|uniref:Uncharacterized protein n=1 Tax=Araneus ventricosus TaxID=182803 RepID=A0A4Y2SE99_ARAVE|nr:hypothetical protein AVEN_191032-1 [Araneus ventricosus]